MTADAADAEATDAADAEATDAANAELEAALAEGNARPKVTMATLPGGPDRDQVMPADAEQGRWSPYAFTLDAGNPADLIASGRAAVQDEASQLAAIALTRAPLAPGRRRARRTLARPVRRARAASPACCTASPASPPPHASLIAAELHPHRAALVKETLARADGEIAPAEHRPGSRWSSPTAPGRPGPTAASTGCWSTPPARDSARSAAAPRPAGGRPSPTSRR